MNYRLILIFFAILSLHAKAFERELISRENYINKWKNEAVMQMEKYKIPASITLAQGILESNSGNSTLAQEANNHFGIKCHNWTGKSMKMDDDKKNECFRVYDNAEESYEDHSRFIALRDRYKDLFLLRPTDYKGWAKGLKKAGYATNPKYPELLIGLIERYKLMDFDRMSSDNPLATAQPVISTINKKHSILLHENNIKYIVIQPGDTFYKIAKEMEMGLWQLYKYNDLKEGDFIQPGEKLYLQPKRKKASKSEHIVREGETMKAISQLYGIKLKSLYKKNGMELGNEPEPGQTLSLRKNQR